MVIDSSAILAILLLEPEAETFARKIQETERRIAPASGLLEASIVMLARHGVDGFAMLDDFRAEAEIVFVPFDEHRAVLARDAFRRFGKVRHKAALDFGDCVSYALAKSEGLPLLFKGEGFRLTDIEAAV